MCRKKCKLIIVILAAFMVLASVVGYFTFVSFLVYQESSSHLKEIYTQSNKAFNDILSEKWKSLDDWLPYLEKAGNDEEMLQYISDRQEQWGFTDFYFITYDGDYITSNGKTGYISLRDQMSDLMENRKPIVVSAAFPGSPELIFFAVPAFKGEYGGFEFEAVGISYNNSDMAESLKVSAFEGCSESYVIDSTGRVIIDCSMDTNKAFFNLLSWLGKETSMGTAETKSLSQKINRGDFGVTRFVKSGEGYYLVYQPTDLIDWTVVGIVPTAVVNASMNRLQAITIPVIIALSVFIFAIVIFFIVSENRKNLAAKDAEILYREELFGILTGNSEDIYFMVDDGDYKVTYVSPNIEKTLGLREEDIRANIRLVDELAASPDTVRVIDKFSEIGLGEQKQFEREYIHCKTGECLWFLVTVYHAEINDEKKYVIILSDRTRERRMNQTLSHALQVAKSANEAKSNFLANMSHDIRTPMNAIVGFSVLLRKNTDNPDKVKEYTEKIISSGHHLLSLINDVLDMSKIESGKTSLNPTEFRLAELIEEIHTIVLPQMKMKKLNFEMRSRGRLPEYIVGDRLRINQILLNLLSNAIKYTPEHGSIILTTEGRQKTAGLAQIRFTVEDNGYGMSPEFLKNVFDPFAREDNEKINGIQGTGLGMAITKNIVELMGGSITVHSNPGQGSIFTIDLELQTVAGEPDKEFWKEHGITRMLVADDMEDVCVDVRELMAETGVEVDCAIGGKEAVRMASAAAEIHEEYHIIILDWKMPDMDGVEAARRIREKVGDMVPVMVLTSYDFDDIEEEARGAGITAFLNKPFFVSSFRREVEKSCVPAQKPDNMDSPDENVEFAGMRILAAEDNESNAEILTELLKIEGIECEIAENGKEAVDMFNASKPGYYDMIFMDIAMPVMDGYEAAGYIRSSVHPDGAAIPIVAMTAYVFEDDVRRAFEAGMDAHTAKPIDIENVKMLMRQLRGKK
ncbi:MAG: response regulator [Firmicutes bacterium]|nr:response regulator [Bacillota bacterium]